VVGTIVLKSHVQLHLASSALILGSKDLSRYATNIARCGFVNESAIDKCLLYAEHAENISITGTGTIDGQGGAFPGHLPDGKLGERPMLIRFFQCTNVVVKAVTLRSAGAWCSHYRECDGVRIHGITIHNRANGNGDGIDLMSTRNVRISDCTLLCQDDAICFQNMSDERPTENIVIDNCILSRRYDVQQPGDDQGHQPNFAALRQSSLQQRNKG
jgi:polygalacturonase